MSLPARGAWIEIYEEDKNGNIQPSLPARGAWIEMASAFFFSFASASLPARGAWIEIDIKQLFPLLTVRAHFYTGRVPYVRSVKLNSPGT